MVRGASSTLPLVHTRLEERMTNQCHSRLVFIGSATFCLFLAVLNLPYLCTTKNAFAFTLSIVITAVFVGYAIKSKQVTN